MLDKIQGKVIACYEHSLSCSVQSGMSLEIFVFHVATFSLESSIDLWLHMHWSAENGPVLFGFEKSVERTLFRLIIGCSGIGPRLALALLAQLGVQELVHAVENADTKAISQVSGIGQRKAEHLILYLKHKIEIFARDFSHELTVNIHEWRSVIQALESLGYTKQEIQRVTAIIKQDFAHLQKFDQLLKKALSLLS